MFHRKRGELWQCYRDVQEDKLGSIVDLIVLWNMIYIDAALNHLRAEGRVILDEDVACLSPFGFRHTNMLERYRSRSG